MKKFLTKNWGKLVIACLIIIIIISLLTNWLQFFWEAIIPPRANIWWIVTSMILIGLAILAKGTIISLIKKSWGELKPLINVARSSVPAGSIDETLPPKYWAITALIYLTFFAIFATLTVVTIIFVGWVGIAWSVFALTFTTYYTVSSFQTIDPDKQGVKTFFGKAIQNLDSGLVFAPLGICKVKKFTKNILDFEIGQERDKEGKAVVREHGENVYASVEPFRVTFSSSDNAVWTTEKVVANRISGVTRVPDVDHKNEFQTTEAKGDPLNHRLTTDPRVVILAQIVDPKQFIAAIGDPDMVLRKLERVVSSVLQEYCARRTPSFVLHYLENAVVLIQRNVEILVGDQDISDADLPAGYIRWGIDIIAVRIPSLGINYAINASMVEARAASYTKRATIEEGRGTAEAAKLLLEAQATGQAAWVKALHDLGDPELARMVITADAAKEMAKSANLVITPQNDLFGWLAGAQQLFRTGQGPQGGQTPPRPPQGGQGGGQSQGNPQSKQGPQPGPTPTTP